MVPAVLLVLLGGAALIAAASSGGPAAPKAAPKALAGGVRRGSGLPAAQADPSPVVDTGVTVTFNGLTTHTPQGDAQVAAYAAEKEMQALVNAVPSSAWYNLALGQAPSVAAAFAGRPDPFSAQPADIANYANAKGVSVAFLYPEYDWAPALYVGEGINDKGVFATDPDALAANTSLGQNNSVVWWARTDGSWSYEHKQGIDPGTVASQVLGAVVEGTFNAVADVVKPFAETLGLGGSLDDLNGKLQASIAATQAAYQKGQAS